MKIAPAILLSLLVTVIVQVAAAAPEEQHATHAAIPYRLIGWQIFNLVVLFAGLAYFLKEPIRNFFRDRQAAFREAAEKSAVARAAAEKQYHEIKSKIDYLDRDHQESLARAEAEASDLRHQTVREAEEVAGRIRKEAETTARLEVQRARQELHEHFVNEAVAAARKALSSDIGNQDHTKLQSEFVNHLETVNA